MLFIDMDGVIAQYEPNDYLTRPFPLESLQHHYFAERKCVENMVEALLILQSKDVPFAFLTTVGTDAIPHPMPHHTELSHNALCNHHRKDKGDWLCSHGFDLSRHPLIAAINPHLDKVQAAKFYLKTLTLSSRDVLIDDFDANLHLWNQAQGYPVKFYNHINTPSTRFKNLSVELSAKDLASELIHLA